MTDSGPEADDLRRAMDGSAEEARPSPDCPDPGRFWEAQRGELPGAEVRELVDHTVTCPACAEAWRIAHAMGAAETRAERSRELPAWRIGLAAAAVLVLAVGLAILFPGRPLDDDVNWRSGRAAQIRSLVPESSALPRAGLVLRWSAGPEGTVYRVHLTNDFFAPVAAVEGLEETEWRVPEEQLAKLPAGARLLWRVDALLPDGRRTQSPTFFVVLE